MSSSLATVDLETGETVGPSPGVTSPSVTGRTVAATARSSRSRMTSDERGTQAGVSLYDVATGRQIAHDEHSERGSDP